VFWFLPNDFTCLRCAIACGGKIVFGTPSLTTYHEYPAWITEKVLDAAKPWQEALLAHVQSAGSHAIRQGLTAAGYSLEFHQQMPEALKEEVKKRKKKATRAQLIEDAHETQAWIRNRRR
jgi:hypothetical protein